MLPLGDGTIVSSSVGIQRVNTPGKGQGSVLLLFRNLFSNIHGLYPLEANSCLFPAPTPLITAKISPDVTNIPWRKTHSQEPLFYHTLNTDTFRLTQTFRLRLEFRGSTVIQILPISPLTL